MKKTAAFLLALALTLALAACGGGEDPAKDTSKPSDTSAGSATDTADDTSADTASDTSTDTSADTATDTSTDTSADTTTDTAEDRPDPILFKTLNYIGDTDRIALSAREAARLAGVLEEETMYVTREVEFQQRYDPTYLLGVSAFAALFDTGNGVPAMLFVGGGKPPEGWAGPFELEAPYVAEIWSFVDGELVCKPWDTVRIYEGYLLLGGYYPDGTGYDARVYPVHDGVIDSVPSTCAAADMLYDSTYEVDGVRVGEAAFNAWVKTWAGDSPVGFSHGSDVSARCWGMDDAEAVLRVLKLWAGLDGTVRSRGAAPYTVQDLSIVETLDTDFGNRNMRTFCQIVHFDTELPGYSYAEGRAAAALEKEHLNMDGASSGDPGEYEYYDEITTSVTYDDGKLLSFMSCYEYFGGGVTDHGTDGRVYDLTRGKRLTLGDLVSGQEYEIREAVRQKLIETGWDNDFYGSELDRMSLEDFDFYLSPSGNVMVCFDKYEIADGASGEFEVELPRA